MLTYRPDPAARARIEALYGAYRALGEADATRDALLALHAAPAWRVTRSCSRSPR